MHVRGGQLRETPLHIASRVKDGERCALMLLKSGAGPNLTTDDGQTPVHVASKNGNLQTLMLLLDDGGDAMYKSNVSKTPLSTRTSRVSYEKSDHYQFVVRRNSASYGLSGVPAGNGQAINRRCKEQTWPGSG